MSFHNDAFIPPLQDTLELTALTTSGEMHSALQPLFVRLCWRRMLRAKCSPALWVTESKEAQQHRGFDVSTLFFFSLPFVSQSVLEQCRSAGGWLGGLLEQLIPDNVRSSRLWITDLLHGLWHRIYLLFSLSLSPVQRGNCVSLRQKLYNWVSYTCTGEGEEVFRVQRKSQGRGLANTCLMFRLAF